MVAACIPEGSASAQSMVSPGPQQESAQALAPAKSKRSMNPESIKRAKLTRLTKDVALTDEQTTKVKPIIDAYVNELQAVKNDVTLDSRSKRQKLSELRQRYEKDLDAVAGRDRLDGLRGAGLVRTLIDAALVYFAGAVAEAPFCLTKKTRNFAGFVVLAFRETV